MAFYLSTDVVVDVADELLCSFQLEGLAAESEDSQRRNCLVPEVPAGDYRVLAVFDADEEIDETDESNNLLVGVPIQVLMRLDVGDLVVRQPATITIDGAPAGATVTLVGSPNTGSACPSPLAGRVPRHLEPDDLGEGFGRCGGDRIVAMDAARAGGPTGQPLPASCRTPGQSN